MLSSIEILTLIAALFVGVLVYRVIYACVYSIIAKELKGVNFLYGFLDSLINFTIERNAVEQAVNSIRSKKNIVVNKDNFVSNNELYKLSQTYNNIEKQEIVCDSIAINIETVLSDLEVMMREIVESINTYKYLHSAKFINDFYEAQYKVFPYFFIIGIVVCLFSVHLISSPHSEIFEYSLFAIFLISVFFLLKTGTIVSSIVFSRFNSPLRYSILTIGKSESPYSVTAVAEYERLKSYICILKLNKYCDEFSRKNSVKICKVIANVGSFEYFDFAKVFNTPPNANKFVVVYLLERVEGVEVIPIKKSLEGNESYLITSMNKSVNGNIRTEYLDEL